MKNGEIWYVRFYPQVGKEIAKTRPAVIVSDDAIVSRLGLRTIVPVTEYKANLATSPWYPTLLSTKQNGLKKKSIVDCIQIKSMDASRFIERIGVKVVSTTISEFPAIVGHKGTIQPLILNGQISNYHCEANWNWVRQEYQIQDGMDGKPSTNHIYFSDGGELILCDRAVLKTLKDRLYLLRTIDGKEGYLELFDPNKQDGTDDRSTLSLDPQLVEVRALVIKADERAIEGLGVAIETKAIARKSDTVLSTHASFSCYYHCPFKVTNMNGL